MTSRGGTGVSKVRLTDPVKPGLLFMPLQFQKAVASLLANPAMDPISKAPEIEVYTVRFHKTLGVQRFTNRRKIRS